MSRRWGHSREAATAWSCVGVAGPLIINAIADYQIAADAPGRIFTPSPCSLWSVFWSGSSPTRWSDLWIRGST